MIDITAEFINQFAGKSSAVSNGKSLASKNSFTQLNITEDQTLIFGSCKGSGKIPYNCSVDFSEKGNPIARCSCPSRQIPCKHAIGLLFCYLLGKEFTKQAIPEDISIKRDKIKKKEEKKLEQKEEKPKEFTKAKATAAIKKCRAQLEGVTLGEKILHNIVLAGVHSLDKKNEKLYITQIKELGNYYIGGIQASFNELILLCSKAQKEQNFTDCIDQINYTYALLKKAKTYLQSKINDYEAFPKMTETAKDAMLKSPIEEQIGYAWKLSELQEHELFKQNVELIQAAFHSYEDMARKQYIDEGVWMELSSGEIYRTYNYRPFRAQNYIKEEDSFFSVLLTEELYLYPGEKNPRARWEKSTYREVLPQDLKNVKKFAGNHFLEIIKQVKSQIKNQLSDKNPIYALHVAKISSNNENEVAIFDETGTGIPLELEKFGFVLTKLHESQIINQMLICQFHQNLEDNRLYAVPIAVINDEEIIRLYY